MINNISLIGDISDPKKDVAALTPLVDHIIDRVKAELIPALADAIVERLAGLTVVKK